MFRFARLTRALFSVVALLLVAACTTDSSGEVAGDGSFAGLQPASDDPEIARAAELYGEYLVQQVDLTTTATTVLTTAIRSGDVFAARNAYPPARELWMTIWPAAPLLGVDPDTLEASVDDHDGALDPDFAGWHKIEYFLYAEQTTEGAAESADQLDVAVAALQAGVPDLVVPPAALTVIATTLIRHSLDVTLTGSANRWSKTEVWDIDAALAGARATFVYLSPALLSVDVDLRNATEESFFATEATWAPLQVNRSWAAYCVADDPYPSLECQAGVTVDATTQAAITTELTQLHDLLVQVQEALDLA